MDRNILFVGSHPDDIELGCLGSILYYVKNGGNVYCIIASDGEGGNPNKQKYSRIEETIHSLTIAGVKTENIVFLKLPDRELTVNSLKITEAVEKLCNEKNINWVFLQTDQDTHQDHRALHHAALSGARNVSNILLYESSSSTTPTFSPNYFIDIDQFIEEKTRLLELHESQKQKNYMEVSRINGLARYRASQCKHHASHAEAFEVFRLIDSPNGNKKA